MKMRNITKLIFIASWITVAALSITTAWYSIWSAGFLEANPNASIVWVLGVYGSGLGSLSVSARMMGYAVAGLISCISSSWIFPLYLKIHCFKDEDAE